MWTNQDYPNDSTMSQQQTTVSYYNKEDQPAFDATNTNGHCNSYTYAYNNGENNFNNLYERETVTSEHRQHSNYHHYNQQINHQTTYNPEHYHNYVAPAESSNEISYHTMVDCSNSSPSTNSATSEESTNFNNNDNSRRHFNYENNSNDRISSTSSPTKSACSSNSPSSSTSFNSTQIETKKIAPVQTIPILPTLLMPPTTSSMTTTTTITAAAAVAVSLINTNEAFNNSPIPTWNSEYYSNSNNPNGNSYNSYGYTNEIVTSNNPNQTLEFTLPMHQRVKTNASNYNFDLDGLNNSYLINQYSSNNKSFQSNLTFSGELANNGIGNNNSSNNNMTTLIKETFTISTNRNNINARLTANYPTNAILYNNDTEFDILHNINNNNDTNEPSDINQSVLKAKKNYSGKLNKFLI